MIGSFQHRLEHEGVEVAISGLSFQQCLPYFTETGVAPNDSEASCAKWLFDIATTPIVELFRANELDHEAMQNAQKVSTALSNAVEGAFAQSPRMASLLVVCNSARVLFDIAACDRQGRLPHAPSALKDALRSMSEAPAKSPVQLAFQHGVVGLHVQRAATDIISGTAKDETATNTLQRILPELQTCLDTRAFDAEALTSCLQSFDTAISMYGRGALEQSRPRLLACHSTIVKILQAWETLIVQSACSLRADLGSVLNAVAILHPQPSPDGVEQPSPVPPEAAPPQERNPGDALELLVEQLQEMVESPWCSLGNVGDVAAKVEKHLASALQDASAPARLDHIELFAAASANKSDGVVRVRKVLQSSRYLLSSGGQRPYVELLKEWADWRNEVEQNSRKSLESPVLQQMVDGVQAVFDLIDWLPRHRNIQDHSGGDSEDINQSTFAAFVEDLLNSSLPTLFTKTMNLSMESSLKEAHAASMSHLMSLQDAATINRLALENRLSHCISLLLSGSTCASSTMTFEKLHREATAALQSCSFDVPADYTWPFSAPFAMAQQCLGMLASSGCGSKETRHTHESRGLSNALALGIWPLLQGTPARHNLQRFGHHYPLSYLCCNPKSAI